MPASLQEINSLAMEQGEKMGELRAMPVEDRGDTWTSDVLECRNLIYALDAEQKVAAMVTEAEFRQRQLDLLGGPMAALGEQGQPVEYRSAGELFTQHDDFEDWLKRGARASDSPVLEIERRNLLATTVPTTSVMLPVAPPLQRPQIRRRLFVRDLIAGGTTNLTAITYVQELNPNTYELGASAVAEASAKPEVRMEFEQKMAPVVTIAAWIPVTRQTIEDIPTMRSYIDGRLGYMVELREEEEILRGPGTGARMTGILNSGIQTQAFATDGPKTIGMAISKIEMVDGEADGVAINPIDFWTMATTRYANTLDGGFVDRGLPYGEPPSMIWGLPAVRTRGIASGNVLVGAWRTGAQVFDRSQMEIRVTDSHDDLFIKNTLVILAESRLGLAVYRPDFFVSAAMS